MNAAKALFLVFLVGLTLRLAPVAVHEMPLIYDAWFHANMANQTINEGKIPEFVDIEKTKPNNYPPFYALTLARLHYYTGVDINALAGIVIPLISSLFVLSAFVFANKLFGEKKAILVAFLGAVFVPLVMAAYDSPENVMFFMLPVILFLFLIKREKIAAFLYAFGFFWNYFFMLVTVLPFLLAFRKNREAIKHFFLWSMVFFGIQLLLKGTGFLRTQSLKTGMEFLFLNIKDKFPLLAIISAVLFLAIFFFAKTGKNLAEKKFLTYFGVLSLLLMLSFPLSVLARPWEQVKFVGLAGVLLTGFFLDERKTKMFFVFLAAFMIIGSMIISTHTIMPIVNKNDFHALSFLEKLEEKKTGKVLAQPSVSEFARANSSRGNLFVTSLYFENSTGEDYLEESLLYLSSQGLPNEKEYYDKTGVKYLLFNFEDEEIRGTEKFEEKSFLDKVYAGSYKNNCILGFFGKTIGYDCGENQTKIFEYNLR